MFWNFRGWKMWYFLYQKVDGKMIFTGYREVLALSFSVMGNTIFFSVKKLIKRWCFLGLFELSITFQDLGNTVFGAVYVAPNSHWKHLIHTNCTVRTLIAYCAQVNSTLSIKRALHPHEQYYAHKKCYVRAKILTRI